MINWSTITLQELAGFVSEELLGVRPAILQSCNRPPPLFFSFHDGFEPTTNRLTVSLIAVPRNNSQRVTAQRLKG